MSGELKGCPFCGSDNIAEHSNQHALFYWHQCGACGAETKGRAHQLDARELWNRRAPDQSAELVSELVLRLEEARDYVNRFSDVVDGDYGEPHPNEAMQFVGDIDATLAKAKAGGA